MQRHPHLSGPERRFNTVYVAAQGLSISRNIRGSGVFRYQPELSLSVGARVSEWSLPACFHPDYCLRPLTYHRRTERWSLDGNAASLRSTGRGQEFVVEANEGILAWARALIEAQS